MQRIATSLAFLIGIGLALFPAPTPAQDRPIVLSLKPGILHTNGFLDVLDGSYSLLTASLLAELSPRIGYSLDLGLARTDGAGSRFTTRTFSAGPVVSLPLGRLRARYRSAFGVVFTRSKRATLFEHGPSIVIPAGRSWRVVVDARHIIANDWVQQIQVDEPYGVFSMTLGLEIVL